MTKTQFEAAASEFREQRKFAEDSYPSGSDAERIAIQTIGASVYRMAGVFAQVSKSFDVVAFVRECGF